jgi:hypothetical protein
MWTKTPLILRQLTHSLKTKLFCETTELRPVKYLNNIVEQDHRFIKRLVNPGMGFGSFNTGRRTLRGYEATSVAGESTLSRKLSMNMIRKGQVQGVEKGDIMSQVEFVYQIFGVAAFDELIDTALLSLISFCNTTGTLMVSVNHRTLPIEGRH